MNAECILPSFILISSIQFDILTHNQLHILAVDIFSYSLSPHQTKRLRLDWILTNKSTVY